jgi:hypothetical protein
MAKGRRRIAPPTPPPGEAPAAGPAAPDVFRGEVVPVNELADTINRWHREGFELDDWCWLDGAGAEDDWKGTAALPRVYVWAVRRDD